MFDINKELVLCDGMVMRRRDAIEYMKGRLELTFCHDKLAD